MFDAKLILDQEASSYNDSLVAKSLPDETYGKYFTINEIFSTVNVNLMRTAYTHTKHTSTFDPNKRLTVACHIRRGDIVSMPFVDRYTDMDFFVENLKMIYDLYPYADIHIYSDSDIPSMPFPCIRHTNDSLLDSVHDMSIADILLMTVGSNVSLLPGLLSKGIVFFDKRKLIPCFNNKYNIHWSKYTHFIYEKETFLEKIALKVNNDCRI
jgi:hypothetical protein